VAKTNKDKRIMATKQFEPIVPSTGILGISGAFDDMRATLAARQEQSNLTSAYGAMRDFAQPDSFGRIAVSFPEHLVHISEHRSLQAELREANKRIEKLEKDLAREKAQAEKYPGMKARAERAERLVAEQQEAFETFLTIARMTPEQVDKLVEQVEREASVNMTFVNETIRRSRAATKSTSKIRALTSKVGSGS